jgi:hypothetical protein
LAENSNKLHTHYQVGEFLAKSADVSTSNTGIQIEPFTQACNINFRINSDEQNIHPEHFKKNYWQKSDLLAFIRRPDIQKSLICQLECIASFPGCKSLNFLLPNLQAEHFKLKQTTVSIYELRHWMDKTKKSKNSTQEQCTFKLSKLRRNLHLFIISLSQHRELSKQNEQRSVKGPHQGFPPPPGGGLLLGLPHLLILPLLPASDYRTHPHHPAPSLHKKSRSR